MELSELIVKAQQLEKDAKENVLKEKNVLMESSQDNCISLETVKQLEKKFHELPEEFRTLKARMTFLHAISTSKADERLKEITSKSSSSGQIYNDLDERISEAQNQLVRKILEGVAGQENLEESVRALADQIGDISARRQQCSELERHNDVVQNTHEIGKIHESQANAESELQQLNNELAHLDADLETTEQANTQLASELDALCNDLEAFESAKMERGLSKRTPSEQAHEMEQFYTEQRTRLESITNVSVSDVQVDNHGQISAFKVSLSGTGVKLHVPLATRDERGVHSVIRNEVQLVSAPANISRTIDAILYQWKYATGANISELIWQVRHEIMRLL